MRIALVTLVLASACTHSNTPIKNEASAQCGGLVWPVKLDHPSTPETHRAAAMRVLEASGMRTSYSEMLEISLKSMLKVNPTLAQFEQAFRDFFAQYASFDAIAPDFADLYMKEFDELQLRQIEAFYRTPTGTLAVQKLASIMQAGGKIGEHKVQEHQKELMDMLMKAQKQQSTPPAIIKPPTTSP